MEIKIDTKKDSPEEIQHMIDFLSRFISANEQSYGTQNAETSVPTPSDGMFGMFGSDSAPTPEPEQKMTLEPY